MENYRFMCSYVFLFSSLVVLCFVAQQASAEKEIPMTRLGQNIGGPTMKFLYCYSCGYRKAFEDFISIIHQKYPDMVIEGRNYDPPGLNLFLSRLIALSKLLVILCIVSGVNIFQYFGQPQPSWWNWCIENKLYSCMMLFFLCNIVEGQLMASGAFEISLNDVPVWSKLETGRIPQPAELFQIIDSHLQFVDSTVEFKPGFAK